MPWCFAKVNGKLAEIYFENSRKKLKISGFCYVDRKSFKTVKEKKWIKEDAAKYKFVYRNRKYKEIK